MRLSLENVKEVCLRIRNRGTYSIDPKEVRKTQLVCARFGHAAIELTELALALQYWRSTDCEYLDRMLSQDLCKCVKCRLFRKAKQIKYGDI